MQSEQEQEREQQMKKFHFDYWSLLTAFQKQRVGKRELKSLLLLETMGLLMLGYQTYQEQLVLTMSYFRCRVVDC